MWNDNWLDYSAEYKEGSRCERNNYGSGSERPKILRILNTAWNLKDMRNSRVGLEKWERIALHWARGIYLVQNPFSSTLEKNTAVLPSGVKPKFTPCEYSLLYFLTPIALVFLPCYIVVASFFRFSLTTPPLFFLPFSRLFFLMHKLGMFQQTLLTWT